jgi:hypothetical protein
MRADRNPYPFHNPRACRPCCARPHYKPAHQRPARFILPALRLFAAVAVACTLARLFI